MFKSIEFCVNNYMPLMKAVSISEQVEPLLHNPSNVTSITLTFGKGRFSSLRLYLVFITSEQNFPYFHIAKWILKFALYKVHKKDFICLYILLPRISFYYYYILNNFFDH